MKSTKQSKTSSIVPWDNSLFRNSKHIWMNHREEKKNLPVIRTQRVVVHWLCLKGLRKLGGATTFHTPQATWMLGGWRKIPKAGDWSITNCNSTVSIVARETNLGTVVPFETWLKNAHGWLEYRVRTVFDPCAEQYNTDAFLNSPTALSVKRGAKACGSINTPQLPSPQLTASGVKLKTLILHRDMNLPHFKDMTPIEDKNVETKQFYIAGKHLHKYEDFQSCQLVLKTSTFPSLTRYLTFPNTRIE